MPFTCDGTRLSYFAFSCAVGLRLGADVAAMSICSCGDAIDPRGDHALCCRRNNRKHALHNDANARIKRALADGGIATTVEPVGLDVANGKRPDGSTILSFARGRDMACYATISHKCATTYIFATAAALRAAAELAKEKKALKYASIA